jgi:hypothetical protein
MQVAEQPCAAFGYAIWATEQNFIRPQHGRIGLSAESHELHFKDCPPTLKGTVRQKIVNLETALLRPLPSMLESFQVKENIYSALWTTTQNDI